MQAIKYLLVLSRISMARSDERDQQCNRKQEGEEDRNPLRMGLFVLLENFVQLPAHTAGFFLEGK